MSQKPIVMEQLKQILQLKASGIGIREMARRIGISRNSVRKYLSLLDTVNEESSNRELVDKAYDNDILQHDADRLKDVTAYLKESGTELSRTGVTRQLLWKEYIERHPDGYSYSRYCYHLNQYLKNADLSMHLEYQPADMIMIDFAGKKRHYVDMSTGECIECEVFVAILPFSGLIFSKAVHSRSCRI